MLKFVKSELFMCYEVIFLLLLNTSDMISIVALNGYVTTVLKVKPEGNARKFNELHPIKK